MKQTFYLIFLVIIFILTNYSCSNDNNSKQDVNNTKNYIKNISAASIYDPLQKKGFSIDKQFASDFIFVDCNVTTAKYNEHVRISGDDPFKIVEIRASFTNYSRGSTDELSLPFLGFISTIPYENSNPEQARNWLTENISKNSKIDINGITFENIVGKSKVIRTLIITPTE